jgi:hypothetical protein
MKFVLLIYQGTTPLPGSDRWAALSEAEQKAVYAGLCRAQQDRGSDPGAATRAARVVEDGAGAGWKAPRHERNLSAPRRGGIRRLRSGEH